MKKFLMMFCVALVCATVFNGCSKKDDDSNDPQKQIIGKWKETTSSGTEDGIKFESQDYIGAIVEFKSDLSITIKRVDGTIETGQTYSIDGNKINILPADAEETNLVRTFTISDDKLSINSQFTAGGHFYIEDVVLIRAD